MARNAGSPSMNRGRASPTQEKNSAASTSRISLPRGEVVKEITAPAKSGISRICVASASNPEGQNSWASK